MSDENRPKPVVLAWDTGDGIIFVYPVEDVIRIRTNELGREALMYEGDTDSRAAKEGESLSASERTGGLIRAKPLQNGASSFSPVSTGAVVELAS